MSFHVGQKVVCINDTDLVLGRDESIGHWLKKGMIYQIRWIGECPYRPWQCFGAAVRLEGVIRGNKAWPDFPFAAIRFRPVIERKTDIAIFKRLLVPSEGELV